MKLAAGQAKLEECPYVSDEAKEALAEAARRPYAESSWDRGRRSSRWARSWSCSATRRRFVNPAAMGVLITDSMSDDELKAKVEEAGKDSWDEGRPDSSR